MTGADWLTIGYLAGAYAAVAVIVPGLFLRGVLALVSRVLRRPRP